MKIKLHHITSEDAAKSIVSSQSFKYSPESSMLGPGIYFAKTAADCEKKAHQHGVVLVATVEVGRSLVSRKASYGQQLRKPLPEMREFLRTNGCDSVYCTELSTGDEYNVPYDAKVTNIKVAGYYGRASTASSAAAPAVLPFWQWPQWVTTLAHNIGVDHDSLDRISEQAVHTGDKMEVEKVGGVRINAAGRPIHSDGRFMSYETAKKRGWTPVVPKRSSVAAASKSGSRYTVSANPTGPLKKDGTPDMRYKANREPSGGSAASRPTSASAPRTVARPASAGGSRCYAVSSNPTGPLKKDGTPDMRYSANRASSSSRPSSSYSGGRSSSSYSGGGYSGGGYSSSYSGGGSSSYSSYSGGGSSGYSGSRCYAVSSSPSGPMKSDGTPDMRYSANRR